MIEHLLNEILIQDRNSDRISDGQGGFSKNYSTINDAFEARISSGSVAERERGGRREAYYVHTLYAASGADVKRDDRFTRPDGTQFIVIAKRNLSLDYHVEAVIEEVRPGA